MGFGISLIDIIARISLKKEIICFGRNAKRCMPVSVDDQKDVKRKKYIPSTCINNCIGISKFKKNCLFECCSNSMQIPLTQLYLAVGCSDYTLLFTFLLEKMSGFSFFPERRFSVAVA